MENMIVADTLIDHLSGSSAAVACIALGLGKTSRFGELDEIARESGEILREAGSILAPWRAGILIACWGTNGNRGCAVRTAALGLHTLRERISRSVGAVSLRISLDVCNGGDSPLTQRREFSRIVRRAVSMALSSISRDAWLVTADAAPLLDSEFRLDNKLGGVATSGLWKSVIGIKERPVLAQLPFGLEWVPLSVEPTPSRSTSALRENGGMREYTLADCASSVPIVLVRSGVRG